MGERLLADGAERPSRLSAGMGSGLLAAGGLVMAKKVVSHRSAVTGRKVTEGYAKAHPSITIRETRPAPKPKGKGK